MKVVLFDVADRCPHAGLLSRAGVIDAFEGFGFLPDGETLKIDMNSIGAFEVEVGDPRRRKRKPDAHPSEGPTNHQAVKRNRPNTVLTQATVPANG